MKSKETLIADAENFEKGFRRLTMYYFRYMRITDVAQAEGVTIPAVKGSMEKAVRDLRMHMYHRMSHQEIQILADMFHMPMHESIRTRLYDKTHPVYLRDNNITYPKAFAYMAQSFKNYRINQALLQPGEEYLNKKERIYSPALVEDVCNTLKRYQLVDSRFVLQSLTQ